MFFGVNLVSNNTFHERNKKEETLCMSSASYNSQRKRWYVSAFRGKRNSCDNGNVSVHGKQIEWHTIFAQNTLFPLIWYQVILQALCEEKKKSKRQTFDYGPSIDICMHVHDGLSSLVQAFLFPRIRGPMHVEARSEVNAVYVTVLKSPQQNLVKNCFNTVSV